MNEKEKYNYFNEDYGIGDKLNIITKDFLVKKISKQEEDCERIFDNIVERMIRYSKDGEFYCRIKGRALTKEQVRILKKMFKSLELKRTVLFKGNYDSENWDILIDWEDNGLLLNKLSNIYNFFVLHEIIRTITILMIVAIITTCICIYI